MSALLRGGARRNCVGRLRGNADGAVSRLHPVRGMTARLCGDAWPNCMDRLPGHAGTRSAESTTVQSAPGMRHERAFPRKRLVNSCTRPLRGNVMDVTAGTIAIRAGICPRRQRAPARPGRRERAGTAGRLAAAIADGRVRRARRPVRRQRRPARPAGRGVLLGTGHPGMDRATSRVQPVRAHGARRRPGGFLPGPALARLAGRGGTSRRGQGISVYPFLFTAESRPIARASRRPVPFAELLGAHAEAERQVARLPPGSPLRVTITGSPGREDSPG